LEDPIADADDVAAAVLLDNDAIRSALVNEVV
jgi:hypothetical protein